MNQSQPKALSKTMFAVEGNPNTMLVIEDPRGMRSEAYWFPHPIQALSWCMKNGCNFCYSLAKTANN